MPVQVELRPSLKAALAPLIMVTIAGIIATLIPFYIPQRYSYVIELALAFILIIFMKGRGAILSIPFFVASLCYFNKYLALLSLLVIVLEDIIIIKLFKSTKIMISSSEIIVKRDYVIKSSIKTIPKTSVAEISVTQGILEKIMGFSDIIIVLRNGEKIRVEGVKKDEAEKALELIRSK